MVSAIVNIYLLWGAWQDFRRRKIRNGYLWIGGISGLVYKGIGMIIGAAFLEDWLLALIPGFILLFIAKVTKEKIGFGDGWVLLLMGNFLNMMEVWYVLQAAVLLLTLVSLIILCTKKVTREYQIPFLPFLWIAHTILWGLNYV